LIHFYKRQMSRLLLISQIVKMGSAEVLLNLETRAVAAERLISLLKAQIMEAKKESFSVGSSSQSELNSLRQENTTLKRDIEAWRKKLTDAEISNGKPVFCKQSGAKGDGITTETAVESAPATASQSSSAKPAKDKPKKEKKEKKEAAPAKEPAAAESPVDVGRLDMRVGHIRTATKHPDADSLYVEEIDVGEEKPRTVISGLVKFIPEAEMQDRMAVILCNLKPSKMRGIMSEAMVMCASTAEKVEILTPPAGSKPGDPVMVEGFARNPDSQLNPKKKIFEACAPDLAVNESREACYKGVRWTVNGKPVTAQSLTNVKVK